MKPPRSGTTRFAFATVLVASLLAGRATFASPTYTITDLGTLPGYDTSVATAINAQGQVVGVVNNVSDGPLEIPNLAYGGQFANVDASFLYSGGKMTQINPIGGPAESINNAGQVVGGNNLSINKSGQYINSSGIIGSAGNLVSGGQTISLGNFTPTAINDSGQIAGSLDGDVAIFQNGHLTDLQQQLGLPSHASGVAYAINNKGDVLFFSLTGSGTNVIYGLATASGQMYPFNYLVGPVLTGFPTALNDKDQVVGGNWLYSNGQYQVLQNLIPSSSGWTNIGGTAINDSGQIAGTGWIDGQEHAFLMTPIAAVEAPEPSTLMFATLMLAWLSTRHGLARRTTSSPLIAK